MRLLRYLKEENITDNWHDYLKDNDMLANAVSILKTITNSGFDAYIVGGAVRDLILGKKPHDIDIATNMPIDQLSKLYKTHDIGKSKDFGIITVNINGFSYEIAQFREDGTYLDGRRPDQVKIVLDFKSDAARRDLTINSMGIDKDGNIIDYFDGKKDIKNKVIRTVGNPMARFKEDKLRMLRTARFASKLGFNVDKSTLKAAKKLSKDLTSVSYERIKDELFKAANDTGDKFIRYLELLDQMKLLRYILPELIQLKYMSQSGEHHPEGKGEGLTIWAHVKAALRQSNTTDPLKNLAILLHDIGKQKTLSIKDGVPVYHGHDEAALELINDIADRLKLSNKEREGLIFATLNHMKFHHILDMKPSKIIKLIDNDHWEILLAVARADMTSRGYLKDKVTFDTIIDKVLKIKETWGKNSDEKITKLIDGNYIMKLTGLKPSRQVGIIINKISDWIIDNDIDKNDKKKIDDKIMEIFHEL